MRIAIVTSWFAMPNGPNPTRSTCGNGPTRSMLSVGMNATTVLVPSTNMSAITGAAIHDRTPHRLRRRPRFSGEDRHVLEPAERAESKLAEDVEVVEGERRDARAERVKVAQMSGQQIEERKE